MPAGDDFGLGMDGAQGALAGVLLLGSAANVYDAFSAVMSSPWSTEKFSENDEADRMANEYVMHGVVISGGYAVAAAILARSVWPLVGAGGVAVYMVWLYRRALSRAKANRTSPQAEWMAG